MATAAFLHHTLKHALLVSVICYLPYIIITPWWLFIFVLLTICYRWISEYYEIKRAPKFIQIFLVIGCLIVLKIQYGTILSSSFYIGFLFAFTGLKITEIHTKRDLTILVFCNFYLICSALISIQELWIFLYLIVAVLANLSLMLKINAPAASLKQIANTSFKHILIALPLCLILFYIFPRVANPLWQVPAEMQKHLGFGEEMNPGSIANLFADDSTAFRVTFKNRPLLNAYWRGIILKFYDGINWKIGDLLVPLHPLPLITPDSLADYEILLEPHQKKWLFYTNQPIASSPALLFSSSDGLVNQNKVIRQRFIYSLVTQKTVYHPLTEDEWRQNTQLPKTLNPQLQKWAKDHYAKSNENPSTFITFLKHYINQNSFWYTLSPPLLVSKNQMDEFWFETKKGYCEQYAGAVTFILRSVGIPARVVMGYQGGEWNSLARYLNVQQNNAHAWLEYWQQDTGWQEFDPTFFIAQERIEQTILDKKKNELNSSPYFSGFNWAWLQQSRLVLESTRFFIERWLLFYNQETQYNLLQRLGLSHWGLKQLLQTSVSLLILFLVFTGLVYQWRGGKFNPLLKEYYLLQQEFRRLNVGNGATYTLLQQCESLKKSRPQLTETVTLFLSRYEKLRLQQANAYSKENNIKTVELLKELRKKLKKQK